MSAGWFSRSTDLSNSASDGGLGVRALFSFNAKLWEFSQFGDLLGFDEGWFPFLEGDSVFFKCSALDSRTWFFEITVESSLSIGSNCFVNRGSLWCGSLVYASLSTHGYPCELLLSLCFLGKLLLLLDFLDVLDLCACSDLDLSTGVFFLRGFEITGSLGCHLLLLFSAFQLILSLLLLLLLQLLCLLFLTLLLIKERV